MTWEVKYLPEADKDIASLARNQQIVVQKAIKKVKENPLPQSEGGYGKPLGHKHGTNLTSFLKIKLRGEGIRIVSMGTVLSDILFTLPRRSKSPSSPA